MGGRYTPPGGNQPARVEPGAAIRAMASQHRQMYVAFCDAGYEPDQAMDAVNTLLAPIMEKVGETLVAQQRKPPR